jgi:hypothetical protein
LCPDILQQFAKTVFFEKTLGVSYKNSAKFVLRLMDDLPFCPSSAAFAAKKTHFPRWQAFCLMVRMSGDSIFAASLTQITFNRYNSSLYLEICSYYCREIFPAHPP